MALTDESTGEIVVKIVYHGASLSGRYTNIQYIYNKTRPEARGGYEAVASETGPNLGGQIVTVTTMSAFDILPLSMAPVRGLRLRLRLFNTPGALYVEGIKERALHGADGVIFVVDSQRDRLEATLGMMAVLATCMAGHGRTLASMPLVLQYNKRDLPDIVPVAELEAVLNPDRRPCFETVATTGRGVFDTLRAVVKPIVDGLRATS